MSGFDLLGVAAALLHPANADHPTLIGLAVGALLILVLVAVATRPDRERPSVDELSDLADAPHLDEWRWGR